MPAWAGWADGRPRSARAACAFSGAPSAKLFIITADDPETSIRIAELVRRLYPGIRVIARARNRQHALRLVGLGVEVVRESFHSSLEMSRKSLLGLGLSADQADARIKRFQRHDEELLKAQQLVHDDKTAVIQTARDARAELETLFESDVLDGSEKG
ncbi:NAD-binding protein [Marinobacterium sedimentorum]|uniref:NAD-binding protein n=1 Tax=Marinobacterium sedimentorum TaxID=2927804 RepID=UPI0027953511|nr:NAD-binding protein [Marinobacterium sedimentorum]